MCFEDGGGETGHAVEDEFFGVAFPSGGEEWDGFAEDWETWLPRREVWSGVIGAVFVEDEEKGKGYEGDEDEEEGEEKMLHFWVKD